MSHDYSAYPGKDTDIVATLRDGRIIAYGSAEQAVKPTDVTEMTITFPDLKRIEYIIEIQFHTVPATYLTKTPNKWIIGNELHLTIYLAAGATICGDALAIGPP